MTAHFKERLLSSTPFERSGPAAFNRFSYQNSWALSHLLNLHESGEDYLIAFDFHDDVLVLDSAENPDIAKFYQIKTKRAGNWTVGQILKRNQSKSGTPKLSYLGKLYHHVLNFPGNVKALFFVSNCRFKIDLTEGVDSRKLKNIQFKSVVTSVKSDILEKLRSEHSIEINQDDIDLFCLEVTTLSLDDHCSHCLGRVAAFLTKYLKKGNIPAEPFHKALVDEISRRAACEFDFANWEDFCEKRAFHRVSFEMLLSRIEDQTNYEKVEFDLLLRLDAEGESFAERERIRKALRECEIDLMDDTLLLVKDGKKSICKQVNKLLASADDTPNKLSDLLDKISVYNDRGLNKLRAIKGPAYLKALAAVCINEY